MNLPRIHGVEFEDCNWLPTCIRDGVIEALGLIFRAFRVYRPVAPRFRAWARAANKTPRGAVLDMGSGSAGHVAELLRLESNEDGAKDTRPIEIRLSDLYPNRTRFEAVKERFPEQVDFVAESVDATNAGARENEPLRCMFCSFHHLRPEQARAVLLDAVRHARGIFICEPHPRKIRNLFANVLGVFFGIFAPFFTGKFTWKRLLFSTLIPIIPLVLVHDGIVSVLRAYTREELEAMLATLPENDFEWEIFEVRGAAWPTSMFPALCLSGRKRVRESSRSSRSMPVVARPAAASRELAPVRA